MQPVHPSCSDSHSPGTVLVLHQTPLKLHVFTSEVSRTQHPARCRSWPFFISLWILGNNHALITRPALARAPWQWVSCTRKHQRCNSRSSLSRQRTLKISLELPGAHSLGVFFAITLHTSHFTLHTSHCTLHAPHFTLHSSHSTLHLIWALLTLSQLISSHLISSHMSPKLSWITSQYYY